MDFGNLKDKVLSTLGQTTDSVMDFAGKAGGNAKDIAAKAADLAKNGGRIAKLTMDVATEKENMRKAFCEIGRLYYETYKDAPEEAFTQLCGEISLAEKSIADKEAEIATLKIDFSSKVKADATEDEEPIEDKDVIICESVDAENTELEENDSPS